MSKREEKLHNDPWDPDFYETGSTRPPKDRAGVVTFLLIMVILLGGLCSMVGTINLRLIQRVIRTEEEARSLYLFEEGTETAQDESREVIGTVDPDYGLLGMEGQTVSEFDRRYYSLPCGVLVLEVAEDLSADLAGIHIGDVIIGLDGNPIRTHEELAQALALCAPGQQIPVELYRQHTKSQITVVVTLPEE